MDIARAKDIILEGIEVKIGEMSIHKRLAVLRYMKSYVFRMADFEVEEAISIDEGKGKLSPELEFKISQASDGYDTWMSKHGRKYAAVLTPEQKKKQSANLKFALFGEV